MAQFVRYLMSFTYRDGVNRDSVISYYVLPTEAKAWFAAVDQTARLATPLGSLAAAVEGETAMVLVGTSVAVEVLNDPIVIPADTVLRGNKLTFSLRSGGRGLVTTIPGRDPIAFVQNSESLQLDLGTPPAMVAFQQAIEAHTVDQFGNAIVMLKGSVVD